jgi:CBS domain containing-hemolysin-like protein
MSLTLAIVLLILAIAGVVVRKTYYYLPVRELKRQAEKHDKLAVQLYRAVAYGSSLRGLLWLYIGLTSAASFVVLARVLPVWASLLVVGPLLWIAFSVIPATRVTAIGARLTMLVTPAIAWLLNYLHPLLHRSVDFAQRHYAQPPHTGIYERDDLLQLIERQQQQTDSRLSQEELEIAKRALSFDEHTVADILTPRKQIKTVLADDTIGPILIDEVHQTGQDFVLVGESKKGPIIGTLHTNRLNLHSQGHVRDVMDKTVYYLHENDNLSQALHAFFVTNHPLFVVVNSFEEYVGVVSVENMLRQLLGHVPGDDFDQYADLPTVAARHTKTHKSEVFTDETGENTYEVLE